jgi:hypothetical protein
MPEGPWTVIQGGCGVRKSRAFAPVGFDGHRPVPLLVPCTTQYPLDEKKSVCVCVGGEGGGGRGYLLKQLHSSGRFRCSAGGRKILDVSACNKKNTGMSRGLNTDFFLREINM